MADEPNPDAPKPETDPAAEVEKWKALARKNEQQAKANADAAKRLADLEEAGKTEAQKNAEALAAAERRAVEAEAKALRLEVAAEKGVKPRWLSGATREELEATADEYLADHPPAAGASPSVPRKPVENLNGGGDPTEDPEPDLRKIVESIPRGL